MATPLVLTDEDEEEEPELLEVPEPDEPDDEEPVEVADDPEPVVVLLEPLPVAEEPLAVEVEVELSSDDESEELVAGQVRLKRGVDDSSCVMANFCLLAPLSSTKLYQ